MKCYFDKCTGNLKPADNGKSPIGVFQCNKCNSKFRKMIQTGKLAIITDLFSTRNQKSISLKELKKK